MYIKQSMKRKRDTTTNVKHAESIGVRKRKNKKHGRVIREKSQQQLASKATVPDSVISSCQIDKYGTGLLLSLKIILDVLSQQNNLIYG